VTTPRGFYPPHSCTCIVVVFDLGHPEASDALDRARAAWGEDGEVEALGPDHRALIIHPCGAQRLLS
jgi:hypothetical protein